MPKYIVKHKEYFLIWSTIVDAPVAVCSSEEELFSWWKEEYGRQGIRGLESEKKVYGHIKTYPLKKEVACNRAGPDESELTEDEIYCAYCLGETINGWSPYEKE
jgi:hypothetical protein